MTADCGHEVETPEGLFWLRLPDDTYRTECWDCARDNRHFLESFFR
jgi:hypothetical protein